MHQSAWIHRTLVGAALAASLPLLAQSSAPPAAGVTMDTAAWLKAVRQRIPIDDLQSGYTCVERETEVRLDGDGRPTSTTIREYELYPSMGGNPPFKRLVARDGIPVGAAEQAELDRRRKADLAGDRDKRMRHEADDRRDRRALADELFALFDFRVTGRETLSGRPAVLVAFTPRAGQTASSRIASIVQKFAGRAWVDEQDLQVVRVEAKSTDDVNYGFGMFARIYKGTSVLWERRKVDDNAWVPAHLEIRADARVLLFRRLGLHRVTDYVNYKRLSSESAQAR